MIKTVNYSKHFTNPLRLNWLRREVLVNNANVLVHCGSCYRMSSEHNRHATVKTDGKSKKIFPHNFKSKPKQLSRSQVNRSVNEEFTVHNSNTNTSSSDYGNGEEETFMKQLKTQKPHNPKDIVKEMNYGSIKFDVDQNVKTKHKIHEQSVSPRTAQTKEQIQNEKYVAVPAAKQSNFFEENYFSDRDGVNQNLTYSGGVDTNKLSDKRPKVNNSQENLEDLNYFDENLLSGYEMTTNKNSQPPEKDFKIEDIHDKSLAEMQSASKSKDRNQEDLNFFDETLLSEYHTASNITTNSFSTNCKTEDISKRPLNEYEELGPTKEVFSRKYEKSADPIEISDEDCVHSMSGNVKYNNVELPITPRVSSKKASGNAMPKNELDSFNYFDEILFGDSQNEKSKRTKREYISNTELGKGDNGTAENVETAYDYVMAMRKGEKQNNERTLKNTANSTQSSWKGKLDSQGFRILTEQVRDVQRLPQSTVISILKKSVIYEDEQLLAINKPYGIASHGGPGIHNSIGKLLQPLAQSIDRKLDQLYMVHRLDKEATGVMLLSKNAACAKRLVEMFKRREVVKKYWAITKGVPNPEEGVIDIPICEATVEGKVRMALKPYYPQEMREDLNLPQHRGVSGAQEAITNFKVLDHHGNAALVLCQPESGIKHQIRCHLAFGLNTPILGDHKYSHLSKIAPQKLPSDMLQRLGIRQSKVRHVAMHLHAATVILPEFNDGKNLFINARLPKHFMQNMKWLKLKLRT